MKRSLVLTGLLAGVVTLAPTLVAGASPVKQPPASVGVSTNVAVPANVLNAKFLNVHGQPETLGALKGDTVFVVPLLTLCGDTCPFTTGNLIQLQAQVNALHVKKVKIVAIDVDPYRDTVHRIAQYSAIAGANFSLWTEAGMTSRPLNPTTSSGIGKGDLNANLSAIEKFLGWSVQVVDQGVPASTDWMAPHEKLTYDINHSDGFWVINATQSVRFISGTKPAYTGKLAKILATFMGYPSNIYKTPVYRSGWTPSQALSALEFVAGKNF